MCLSRELSYYLPASTSIELYEGSDLTTTNKQTNGSTAPPDPLDQVRQKWNVYSHDELKQRCEDLGSDKYLIEGLLPDKSISLLVGDSGLGKSALVYQMALCIAAGIAFLGLAVKKCRVLVLDFENGIGEVAAMLDSLCKHLGLSEAPKSLHLWNINDAKLKYGQTGHTALDIIGQVKPNFLIVDSLTGMFPDIELRNDTATKYLQRFRKLIRDNGTSTLALHHIKKPSNDPKYAPPKLETIPSARDWFLQARGARALINAVDVRLGVDVPDVPDIQIGEDDAREGVALVMRGFARVRGEIPVVYLSRCTDEEGEPLGYEVVTGSKLLFNKEQQATLAKLPQAFRFKDAQQTYGKGAQATTDFLNKCIGLGLIRKLGKKAGYEKL